MNSHKQIRSRGLSIPDSVFFVTRPSFLLHLVLFGWQPLLLSYLPLSFGFLRYAVHTIQSAISIFLVVRRDRGQVFSDTYLVCDHQTTQHASYNI